MSLTAAVLALLEQVAGRGAVELVSSRVKSVCARTAVATHSACAESANLSP